MRSDGSALLAVCTLPPCPITNGYSLRVFNLLRELAARWRITLLAPAGSEGLLPEDIAEHRRIDLGGSGLTYPWRFDQSRLRDAVLGLMQTRKFDRALVWPGAEAVWFGRSGLPVAVMDMIDCNPLEFFRGAMSGGSSTRERLRSLRELGTATLFAHRTVRSFAATACVGEQDAAWMRRIGGRNTVHMVPNGVSLPLGSSLLPEDDRPTLSFTGTLNYGPNVDAVTYLTTALWPRIKAAVPEAILVLAGRNPAPSIAALHGRGGIEVAANVPDMAAVLSRSWISVAPMRTGVGIKNKVLEAWACARPVVMTKLATNGLTLPLGHEELVQASAGGLAVKIVELLRNHAARGRMGDAARLHVLEQFSWQSAADRIDRLLRQ